MQTFTTPAELRAWRRSLLPATVGLVPTMGFLHEGHIALVRRAKAENDAVAVSIFVNPTQFAPGEDFERYPRDEARDLAMLEAVGVDAVYLPSPTTMYPPGFQTFVTVEEVSRRLEGERRPTHLRGVATVVLKLFNAAEPTRAYFGRKDAQQLRVLQRMAADLDLAVEVVPCDIVREADGVAMSSRNVYLTPAQRTAAASLHRGLEAARARYDAGERDADQLRQVAGEAVAHEPLADIDYVSLADDLTLEEIGGRVRGPALLSLAVRFGHTRLLDNIELG